MGFLSLAALAEYGSYYKPDFTIYLYSEANDMINKYKEAINYGPDEISLMKNVVKRLYKHGKYYLD